VKSVVAVKNCNGKMQFFFKNESHELQFEYVLFALYKTPFSKKLKSNAKWALNGLVVVIVL
jgi:hypothetical protein